MDLLSLPGGSDLGKRCDVCYLLGELLDGFLVFGQDLCRDLVAECRVDRMNDILVFAFRSAAGRHRDEETVIAFDDLDIMYDELLIERNRNDCLHLAFQR